LAKHTGLVADEFVYFMGNVHIYEEHRESLETQCQRTPLPFPHIHISGEPKPNIEDYTLEDIHFQTPYRHHPPIVMKMKA
jgi:thymidylate synthase